MGHPVRTLIRLTGTHPAIAVGLVTGSYSAAEDFLHEGFVDSLERRGIEAWVAMAEARAAWFADGSIVQRLRESVVEPARDLGLARLWLAGVSLGALACLCHEARYAGEAEHLVLMSPYPGTRELLREIEAAGGLDRWDAEARATDCEREAWRWLRERGRSAQGIDCYFASGDRFVQGQRRMAQRLPRASVHEMAGGHDWRDWRAMWNDFLERTPR